MPVIVRVGGGGAARHLVLQPERKEPPKKKIKSDKPAEGETEVEITRVYNVSDLVGNDATNAERLIRITTTIRPNSWAELGGAAAIDYHQATGGLVIRQTRDAHEQIKDLLDALCRVPEKKRSEIIKP